MRIKTTTACWSILFILPISYACINFLFDYISGPGYPDNTKMFLYYLGVFVVAREFFIYPSILLYALLFRKINKQNLVFGCLYAIGVSILYGFIILDKEPLFNIQVDQFWRRIFLYPVLSVFIFLYYEFGTDRRLTFNNLHENH